MSVNEQIKKAILEVLPSVECVLAWGPGPDPLRSAPLLIRKPEDAENIQVGPMSVNNLAVFLPEYKGRKIGLVVKGCDSRSVVQLLSESLIKREDVVVIGFGCQGVVDVDKIAAKLPAGTDAGLISHAEMQGDTLNVTVKGEKLSMPFADIKAGKCLSCMFPNAILSDHFAGEQQKGIEKDEYKELAAFEAMSLDERFAFWEKEMSRCIRCYACRNSCPLCVCRDHCVATSRDPHWLTQADSTRDKLFFQLIHASHLAGRCTGCGECVRACPVGIPVHLFKRVMNRSAENLFAFKAGTDPEAVSPLQTFQLEEPTIKERNW